METFERRLKRFVAGCNRISRTYMEKQFPSLVESRGYNRFSVAKGGIKYAKIVRMDGDGSGAGVHCFVNKQNGDVLKAASWSAPAKHARGNIWNEDNGLGLMGPYGTAYLK